MGLYYEDFEIGKEYESPGRTVTEADLVLYTGLSGDYNQLHTDDEYCKKHSVYDRRMVHGLFALTIVEGLKFRLGLFEGTALASLEWTWKHTGPLFVGDTVRAKWSITGKRETSRPGRGIIWEEVRLVNQNDEVIGEGSHTVMMQRRPA